MKQKIEERLKAIQLRQKGYSLNEILAVLRVAKSSVSSWVRNVPLTKTAKIRLLTKIKKGQLISAENARKRTQAAIESYFQQAKREITPKILDTVDKRMACSLIYWCEGEKNHFHGVSFTNSDPKLIRTFLKLFREGFSLDEHKFRVCVHLHQYHNPKKQLKFWSSITGIPKNQFMKPYLKKNTGKRIRDHYEGCINIRYFDNAMARRLLETAKAFFIQFGGVG